MRFRRRLASSVGSLEIEASEWLGAPKLRWKFIAHCLGIGEKLKGKVLAATSDVESLLIFRWLKTKWVLRFESRNENNSCHCWELAVVSLFFSHQIIFYDINSREQLNFPNLNFSHHRKGEKIHKLRPMIFNATFLVALSSICGCTPTHDGSFNLWWFVSLSGKIGFFLRCPEKFTTREKRMEPGGC